MTTKKGAAAPAAAAALEQKTFKLARPITDDVTTWAELTVTEPTLGNEIAALQKAPKSAGPMERMTHRYAILTGVPAPALRKLKTVDFKAIERWLEGLEGGARELEDDRATFVLAAPITVDGKPQSTITLREPDLEAAIIVEKVEGEALSMAATIAALSGWSVPQVRELRMRDVRSIQEWLVPFVVDLNSLESPGEI